MAVDLFVQIASLFRNQTPDGEVPVFVLHRFLVSDLSFAPFVKEFAKLRDDKMVVEIWRGALRKQKPPYLKYTGPKKVASDDLVKKISEVENLGTLEAEEHIGLLKGMGLLSETYAYYGVEEKKSG